jgi:hypothetical protein
MTERNRERDKMIKRGRKENRKNGKRSIGGMKVRGKEGRGEKTDRNLHKMRLS